MIDGIKKGDFEATKKAIRVLTNKGTALDSVEEGVKLTEADPKVRTVGYGGYPDNAGEVTVDASIMDHQNNAGSVAYLKNIKHPISVARKVMENSKHVMLAGDGAYEFAIENGFKHTSLLTNQSKNDWKKWCKNKNPKEVSDKNHDTITQLSKDVYGNIAAASTTSGLAFKRKGRIGDSPIIGSGIYVDNDIGAAGATGIGEEIMKTVGSFLIVELMKQGRSPNEACKSAIKRIIKNNDSNIDFQVAYIAIRKDGEFGASALNKNFFYNIAKDGIFETVRVKGFLEK